MKLNESKRDNFLLKYVELLNQNGVDTNLGRLKGAILDNLSKNAEMTNLSLASNYYLAGAARYYFNGDLTVNKDLALYHDYFPENIRLQYIEKGIDVPENHKDEFKSDVCVKLNTIILYLRNSYIDSVGESFVEPEDFGELPIKELFKKYWGKAKKLQIKNNDSENSKENSNSCGNGYTFDIMYSHNDCKKYCEPTGGKKLGAWCITYGQHHYDAYVNRLNIHYVIFRKNGWENVERVPQKEKWIGDKPQDDYGNSLIALLQSNVNGEPVYITSRWNHGSYLDSGGVNADHAYTKEEFMKITGVTDEELQKIFNLWKEGKGKIKEKKKEKTNANDIRAIKEIQIRINGGEKIENLINVAEGKIFSEGKNGYVAVYKGPNGTGFLVDRNKIVFESIMSYENALKRILVPDGPYANIVCVSLNDKAYMLYDYRRHNFVNVDNVFVFKKIYDGIKRDYKIQNSYYEVATGMNTKAMIRSSDNTALLLPNGNCWYNEARNNVHYYSSRASITTNFFEGSNIIKIITNEKNYYFNTYTRKFLDIQNEFGIDGIGYASPFTKISDRIYAVNFHRNNSDWRGFYKLYEFSTNSIYEDTKDIEFNNFTDRDEDVAYLTNHLGKCIYNKKLETFVKYKGNILFSMNIRKGYNLLYIELDDNFIKINTRDYLFSEKIYKYFIYDVNTNSFLENEYNFPDKNSFFVLHMFDDFSVCLKSNNITGIFERRLFDYFFTYYYLKVGLNNKYTESKNYFISEFGEDAFNNVKKMFDNNCFMIISNKGIETINENDISNMVMESVLKILNYLA